MLMWKLGTCRIRIRGTNNTYRLGGPDTPKEMGICLDNGDEDVNEWLYEINKESKNNKLQIRSYALVRVPMMMMMTLTFLPTAYNLPFLL